MDFNKKNTANTTSTLTSSQVDDLIWSLDYNTTSLISCSDKEITVELKRLLASMNKVEDFGEIKCRAKNQISRLALYMERANEAASAAIERI